MLILIPNFPQLCLHLPRRFDLPPKDMIIHLTISKRKIHVKNPFKIDSVGINDMSDDVMKGDDK